MQYQETIVYCQLREPAGVGERQLERWKDELANRRQYLSYLTSLQEDVVVSVRKVTNIREQFMNELDELGGLVGGRTSVPKEHVYPKFEGIAAAWLQARRLLLVLSAHNRIALTYSETLRTYRVRVVDEQANVRLAVLRRVRSYQRQSDLGKRW